jgi:serine/threonine-protein kinase
MARAAAPAVVCLVLASAAQSAVRVSPAAPLPSPIPEAGTEPRAAALAAAAAAECALLAPAVSGERVLLAGVARRGEEEGVRRVLSELGVAASTVELRIDPFDAAFCDALAAIRPAASPHPAGPRLVLLSPQPLMEGQNLRFRVEMPDWQAFLHVLYLTSDGQAGNLVQAGDAPHARRAAPQFGQPYWRSSAPWGTDLVLVVASERPLFPPRRVSERTEDAVAALSGAVRAAQQSGRRVEAWAFTHRKEPAR